MPPGIRTSIMTFNEITGTPYRIAKPCNGRLRPLLKRILNYYVGSDKCLMSDCDGEKALEARDSGQPTTRTINIIIESITFG